MKKEYIQDTLIPCGLVIAFAIIYLATKQIPAPDSITLDVMLSLVNIGALVSAFLMGFCAVASMVCLLLSALQTALQAITVLVANRLRTKG